MRMQQKLGLLALAASGALVTALSAHANPLPDRSPAAQPQPGSAELPVAPTVAPMAQTPGSTTPAPAAPAAPSMTRPNVTPPASPTAPMQMPGSPSQPMMRPAPSTPGTSVTPTAPAKPTVQTPTVQTPTSPSAPRTAATGTIADVAAASSTFRTLVSALNEAELTEVLKGEGPFTVFAPTDAAFNALPAGTLDELLKPENRTTLVQLLKYHVVSGAYPSSRLAAGQMPSVEGAPITVSITDGKVKVNNANVIQPDITATNGVIHAIDRVILPPSR